MSARNGLPVLENCLYISHRLLIVLSHSCLSSLFLIYFTIKIVIWFSHNSGKLSIKIVIYDFDCILESLLYFTAHGKLKAFNFHI